ncbi:2-hydroxychromene-2-carboxylate isomerase [Saccharothrix tamanrassetensis]|uniref:2-hydroxychromene-2-carboxylate isomerase n=1 Tax=Saccharothrix tamanrassetensis TaxID=1051531 RepID=A0A841CDF1_9PSEU|nr:DsbA family protein [Saccharothrix tamanrassetensis]MBB5954055.1 2-hydroxychromene-2-carboxylate isomerase [Saccharothrix tamanrassetensis]
MSRHPRFYFSLRSPYSWLAFHDLLRDAPEVADAIEWAPFWEPDERNDQALRERGEQFPYVAMSRAKHLYILQDVARLAAARGLSVKWPVDREPVWEIPHLGYLVALREGLGREYIAEVCSARWQHGRDICDRATIADIATRLGLDPDEVSNACDDDGLRARGVELLMDVCRDGVFGVPFFVHRFTRFWGVDRLADFVAHVRSKLAPAGAPPAGDAPGPSADPGHAGGCG